ncbi:MAG TPA: hypothetical protein VGH19_10705 [Verrucomicrobiae bacterium]
MRPFILAAVVAVFLNSETGFAQETTAQKTQLAQADANPGGTNSSPALKLKATKIYNGSQLYSTLVSVSNGRSIIGLTVPARFQFSASESGREITAYLDSSRQGWVRAEFKDVKQVDFTHEGVLPLISDDLGKGVPVFSTVFADGRKYLVYTVQSGADSNTRHSQIQVVQSDSGIIILGATAYGSQKDFAFYALKQIASSLQFAKYEKDLKRQGPANQD